MKSVDKLLAEYAAAWQGFTVDGQGKLKLVKRMDEHRLSTRPTDFQTKAYDEKAKLWLYGVANAAEVDRMTEVLAPGGLIDKPFNRNPILLRQHCHDSPIGNVTNLVKKESGVEFEAWCGDPMAAPLTELQIETRSLIVQKVLRAVSVGFIPLKIRMPSYGDDGSIKEPALIEDWELLELSVVSVPCNASSLFEYKSTKAQPNPAEVQSLIFDEEKFSKSEAKAWAKDHDFRADKVDETETSYRLRQADPGEFEDDSFKTIEITDGIKAVIGKRKKSKAVSFPVLGRDGKFYENAGELKSMDEIKELLKGQSACLADIAKGLNSLADGQKSLIEGLSGKGKKPKEEDEEDDGEEMKAIKARFDTLEKSIKETAETASELVTVCGDLTKAIEGLSAKVS